MRLLKFNISLLYIPFCVLGMMASINSFSQEFLSDGKIIEALGDFEDINSTLVFKSLIEIEKQKVILVITQTPKSNLHGHQFGYRNFHFLEEHETDINIIAQLKSNEESFLGDYSRFEIIDLGHNIKGLVSIVESTGNSHYEQMTEFLEIEIGKLNSLLTINTAYDNSNWQSPASEKEDCQAKSFEETYEILDSGLEWHKIKTTRKNYKFTAGCKEKYESSEIVKNYYFKNGSYQLVK